jgi:hypothetical protein
MKTINTPKRNSITGFLVAYCFVFSLNSATFGVTPAPDGGYANGNTAEGTNALFNLTTGSKNTADGYLALFFNMSGQLNTAIGSQALYHNSAGSKNTAVGLDALFNNTTGSQNTAVGYLALFRNTHIETFEGDYNTAIGSEALASNTTGSDNLANGFKALYSNTLGGVNTANGYEALAFNTTGSSNTADGNHALFSNTTGNGNIAVGSFAGANLTTGSGNIDIGNAGVASESNTIRIGAFQTATFIAGITKAMVTGSAVFIDTSTGQLGLMSSSERFKDAIEPMGKASEVLLSLQPVKFRYKQNIDPKRAPQFGLVAEDVEKVDPDLVVRDADGNPYTVRYEAVNAMLLNEFLKEHRKMQEQEATITQLKQKLQATTARQQKQIEALSAGLQKVSAELEANKPPPQVALSDHN